MTQKQFILMLRDSLEAFIERNDVSVETYRMELGQMDRDDRYAIRLGIYFGGDTANGAIPGTRFRSTRVDTGNPLNLVQTYNIQLSARVPDVLDYGDNNELDLAEMSERINLWINSISSSISDISDCFASVIMYGGTSGISRPTPNYAQATVTFYVFKNKFDLQGFPHELDFDLQE